ncbi:E3 ubiquitin-protein ligase Siah2-like [Lampetra fluviatilis]
MCAMCYGRPHDDRCIFRPYKCPCYGPTACTWQGSLRGVLPHLAQAHPRVPKLCGTDVLFQATNLEKPPPTFWLMVQVCLGHQFILALEKRTVSQEVRFATSLLLVGPDHLAPSFTYRVELGSSHHRRMSYEATPRPLRDGIARVIADKDGLFFSKEVARLFAENKTLAIASSIARC